MEATGTPSCERRLRVSETLVESYMLVSGQHVNALGVLHGGNMIRWLVDLGSTVASRVVRGYALLAGIDFAYLSSPVREGETLLLRSWATLAGRSSVEVFSEALSMGLPVASSSPRRAALSHMTFVAVDGTLRPRPHGACVEASTEEERAYVEASRRLRGERAERIARRRVEPFDTRRPEPIAEGFTGLTERIVNPADSIAYNVMHAGTMIYLIDELAAIIASRYAGGPVVTGFLGPADFYRPVPVGHVVEAAGAVSYYGKSSIEIEVKVLASPMTYEWREAVARAYVTLVHIGPDGKPQPVPARRGQRPPSQEALNRAEERRRMIRLIESGALGVKTPG